MWNPVYIYDTGASLAMRMCKLWIRCALQRECVFSFMMVLFHLIFMISSSGFVDLCTACNLVGPSASRHTKHSRLQPGLV